MKVGYIISPGSVVSGRSGGVRQQALIWHDGLRNLGVDVQLLNPWEHYDWQRFDIIHLFQSGDWLRSILPALRKKVRRLVLSPIIDTVQSPLAYRIASSLEIGALRMRTENALVASMAKACDLVLARSAHEFRIVAVGLGVPESRIAIQHIGFRTPAFQASSPDREPVCLHVSSFYQPRKNALRLIQACREVGFSLWLVGNPGTEAEKRKLMEVIGEDQSIRVLGFVSEAELARLMSRARLFALPSLNEGVGLSAMEAAVAGCEVIITSQGGPRDYFSAYAHYVDPRSIQSIASALRAAMQISYQPKLADHILSHFNADTSSRELLRKYERLNQ